MIESIILSFQNEKIAFSELEIRQVLRNGILPHTLEPYLGFYQTSKPCGNDITSELMDFKTSGEATSFEIH